MATFPLQMREKIFQGQKGIFFPASNIGKISEGIIAVVIEKTIHKKDKNILVYLKTFAPLNSTIQLQAKTKGLIKLEMEQVSPFELLLMRLKNAS